jgi:hypothetical protein
LNISAIERGYQNSVKDRKPGAKSPNLVEYAHFVGTGLMIVHGSFTLDFSQGVSFPFVQVRAKKGDKWLIVSLRVSSSPGKPGKFTACSDNNDVNLQSWFLQALQLRALSP